MGVRFTTTMEIRIRRQHWHVLGLIGCVASICPDEGYTSVTNAEVCRSLPALESFTKVLDTSRDCRDEPCSCVFQTHQGSLTIPDWSDRHDLYSHADELLRAFHLAKLEGGGFCAG